MSKRLLWAVALGIALGLTGCFDKQPEEKPAGANAPPVIKEDVPDPLHDRLLQIAGEYESYGKAVEIPHAAPLPCASVVGSSHMGVQTIANFSSSKSARISLSGDTATHGRKLYYMFAKQVWESRSAGYKGDSYISFPDKSSPVGQAIVKQSWVPEDVTGKLKDEKQLAPTGELRPDLVRVEGKLYRPSRKGELFVMFKLDPSTPGTDNGWVYGNVSADGKTVLSVGRLESCMKCHQDAPHDRLFGLPEENEVGKK